jgi:caffeoyl-CoA O-methyltransferase
MAEPPGADWLHPAIAAYALAHSVPADALQQRLIAETAERLGPLAGMQISADQGALMAMLVQLMGARRAVEVGTFTGYSALAIARALPDDGELLCCDVNAEWTAIGRRYWIEAGVERKIDLRLGPALETLRALPEREHFDVGFIDADKPNYYGYFEEILVRLRPGGLIMVDNTIWSGRVLDDSATDADTLAIMAFNDAVAADPRVDCVLLTIRDGVTLLRKH